MTPYLSREMAVTYLAKENHFIEKAFFDALGSQMKHDMKQYLFLQFKGMLITPYILHNDWKDQIIGEYSHQMFVKKYVNIIQKWIDFVVISTGNVNDKRCSETI